MLASELGREGSLFVGVVDGPLGLEHIQEGAKPQGVKPLRTDPLSYKLTNLH